MTKVKPPSFDDDLAKVLDTPEGRRVLWDILDRTGLVAPGLFTGNSTTFYNLGKRELGVELYNDIMAVNAPVFLDMMKLKLEEGKENG